MSIRLGYQIPNFTYPGGPENIVPTVVAQAQEAEASGFDTVLVMDHFYQLPFLGSPAKAMLECYTLLSAVAAHTSTIQLSALVTGNTYRNPALLAKTVTTLDLVSNGRAILGLGAGWFELEHTGYGYEFGTFTDRFEKLEEALKIIAPMLAGEDPTVAGKHYSVVGAMNNPRLRDDLPIMLGGAGEKKTFKYAAQYAQHLNMICAQSELPTKLAALAARCEEAGRDRSTLETSYLAFLFVDADGDAAREQQRQYHLQAGVDIATLDAGERAAVTARQFAGSPDEVAAQLKAEVLDVGIDSLIVNIVINGHVPGIVKMTGEALAPLVRG